MSLMRLLLQIEQELKVMGAWSAEAPSSCALASTQPFCIDTLEFPQWIQFIFLPKMSELVRQNLPLPESSLIAPMVEEAFRHELSRAKHLVELFESLDKLLSV